MSAVCPNGHDSQWPDWCSTCGERIAGGDAAAAPSAPPAGEQAPVPETRLGPTCDNCGVPRHEHDVFCESCGYDFASGSLPDADPGFDAAATAPPVHVKIIVDPDFFDKSVGDAELVLPDPLPEAQVIPLAGIRILIGRQSASRGVYPELDVRALTGDPAVSTQHALLERDADGNWMLTDLGSTNGTFLTADTEDAVTPGTALPIEVGSSFYIGAWTRIDLTATA